MVKTIDNEIIEIVKAYVNEIKNHYKVDFVILFGSFANGNNHKDSDIDVAVVSSDIKSSFYDGIKLMGFTSKVDLRIEPHAINTEEFNNNETTLIDEIKRTGIQIFAA